MGSCYATPWSPDGQTLALIFYQKPGTTGPARIFTVPARGGKWTELAAADLGDKYSLDWSPDGKWIAYNSDGEAKTRPEGIIWELQVDSFLKNAAAKNLASSSPTED